MTAGGVTWRALWVEASERLGGDARTARWVCEEASGRSGLDWVTGLDDAAGARAVARLDGAVERLVAGEPVQYVLGHWPFRGVDLLVDRRVLIPRPETEEVAGIAIELARGRHGGRDRKLRVADLGTGSGAIGLSMATELPLDGTEVWLTDVSPDALDVARANLAGLGRAARNVRVAAGAWYGALDAAGCTRGTFDVIVSNPPYVRTGSPEIDEQVVSWEPGLALFGGADGCDALRCVIGDAGAWLAPGGHLVVEIGWDQRDAALELARSGRLVDASVRVDAAGLDRVLVARRPGEELPPGR